MANRKELIEVLKRALKREGMTYAKVASKLGLSEISIKRSFSQKNFTLDRLEAICECIDLDLSGLVQLADQEQEKISTLSLEQEQELVSDVKFLLVAICSQNAWQMEEIIAQYDITKPECIRYLIRLERHGLIRLLPNNSIRRMLAHDFQWLPGGPIEKFFVGKVQGEFLHSRFSGETELRTYQSGMLSRESFDNLSSKLQMLTREFHNQQNEDAKLPVEERQHFGMMLAIRNWEFSLFESLQRKRD